MAEDENNKWRIKPVTSPMPRDPGRCLRRISSANIVITTAENKWNTRLIESVPDTACMRRTIVNGANPNATCRLNHVSACHIAAMHDNDALDLLLRSGADVSRADKHGRTPLHLAAWAGHAKQMTLLLDSLKALKGSDTVRQDKSHSLFLEDLVNMPCQPNEESGVLLECWCDGIGHNCGTAKQLLPLLQRGWTALHSASARANHHCVQLLLAAGADASAQDLLCRTPLDVAGCAHYMGHNIDANNFLKTVDLLLRAGGRFLKYCEGNDPLVDTPLHTAVELESKAAVEQLLLGGASAAVWNSQGLTAMHVCVEKRNEKLLQIIANHESSNKDSDLAVVDTKDQKRYTVLCAAIEAEWMEGVCVALGAGASIIEQYKGESPIHIAARLGNIEILQKILNIAKSRNINYCNENGISILFTAIRNNHLDVLKLLLKNGFSIDVEDLCKNNVLHVATEYGRKEILQYLLNYDRKIIRKLINMYGTFGQPLYHAIRNNHRLCAELLIAAGARVNVERRCDEPLLDTAAPKKEYEAAEDIIKQDSLTLHLCNPEMVGLIPLHVACSYGNREIIQFHLRNGADLSEAVNENNSDSTKQIERTAIEILMNNVIHPTEFLQEIFDSYIQSKSTGNCIIVEVDYKVLVPTMPTFDMKQMKVIKALINTGSRYDQDRLLLHPLVQSFLYLKWRSLLPFFYSILVLHVCFVLSLNIFVLSIFWYKDRKIEYVPRIFQSAVWIYIIYFTACLIIIKESIFIATKRIFNYLKYIETCLTLLSTMLAVVVPLVLSWNSECTSEWIRLLISVTLIFTWAKMVYLLSRFADFGYYFLMYGKVATKVFKIIFLFIFLIFGFASSFMIQFHAQPPFEDPWSGLLTTMVMMTAEVGYYDTINAESASHATASLLLLRSIFVVFLFLISIILMNLLIAVAVNDVNHLEMVGHINRLKKQVDFITSFEDSRCIYFIRKVIPTKIFVSYNRKQYFQMHPANDNPHLPDELRQAIFEKAQLPKKQWDEKQKTMLRQIKHDEMLNIIAKNEVTMKEILKELNKMRGELDLVIKRDKTGMGSQN